MLMEFLDSGDKIRKMRIKLNIKQEELNTTGVSRNFISMIENGKRKLPKHVAIKLMEIFECKADEIGIKLEEDEKWLMTSAREQAIEFCNDKLSYDLSAEDIDEVTTLVKNYNIRELIPKVYVMKANRLYEDRSYEEAFTYYYEILDCVKEWDEEKAFIYNKLGKCKIMMLNYIEAITYFKKCYNLSLKTSNVVDKRNCLYNIALSYKKLGRIEPALDFIDEFIKLCDINENFKEYMGAAILKSNCYIELNRYQQAIDILISNIYSFTDSEDILLGYIYNSLGSLYLNINELETALVYLDKACHIREIRDRYNLPRTIFNKAETFLKQGNLENALQLINKTIHLSEENNDLDLIMKCYRQLEKIYSEANKNEDLKELYLEMVDLFSKTDKKEELLKLYIKLLKMNYETSNIHGCEVYLENAIRLI
jgi:HTH-type transcriptional regulator, quorum sensing regulator NprR